MIISLATITTIYGTAMAFAYFFQAYHIMKTKSAKDVSLLMYLVFLPGITLWFLYGLSLNALPLIIANLVGIVGCALIIIMCLKYREK